MADAAPRRNTGRLPRRVTPAYLENAALHYLQRFATSSANLRRVLMRKVQRAAEAHGDDPAEGAALVEAMLARYQAAGLLDDRQYAAAKAASLQRRGTSSRAIRERLAVRGVDRDLISETVDRLHDEEGGDLAAAAAFARRRRLGPFRPAAGGRAAGNADEAAARRNKELAAMARAGFAFDVARRVLACTDEEAVEAMLARQE
ncbi:MAG TPA: RecX family transcriptional regulator [Stellaceae bacterium]|jgi:regulatory protein